LDSGGKSKKRESSDISGDVKRRRLVKDTDSEEIREPSAVVDHPAKVEPTVSVKTRSDRSSSSSSSSSSASSSSSSSASSNSSSGTDSSTSSSSSSEDSDLAIKDKPSAPLRPPTLPAVESSAPRIPPGQGKSATHERNERRKRARQLQKLEARNTTNVTEGESAPEQLSSNGHANSNGDMISYITSELPVPRSMANRNKKRGFLKEMMDVQGSKTVFGFGEDAQGSSTPLPVKAVSAAQSETATPSVVDSTPTRATPRTAASKRVVPPSEMDLPSNVFVTHQVYERPGYGYAPKARRGRVRYDDSAVFDTDKEDLRPAAQEKIIVEQGETGTTMEAREPEVQSMPVQVEAEVAEEEEEDIWTKAETHFEALVPVTSQSVPSKGTKIVWKASVVLLVFNTLADQTGTSARHVQLLAAAQDTARRDRRRLWREDWDR
jgi:hypothetical protein